MKQQYNKGWNDCIEEIEELADMGVMTRQIAYLTGTEAGVGEVTEKKVRRQEGLIREEEYQDGTL